MVNIQLTQELVKSLFDYNDGFLYWKVKRCGVTCGMRAGWLELNIEIPRYRIRVNGKQYLSARIIFLWHHGYFPIEVDHKDRNAMNDKIENLREADRFENSRNTTSRKASTSKYLGVSFNSQHSKWVSNIQFNHEKIYLGWFDIEHDAAIAYNKASKELFGDFANLNII